MVRQHIFENFFSANIADFWGFEMCIIVDSNAAHQIKNATSDGKPVRDWLLDPRSQAGLVVGGKLTGELVRAGLERTMVELRRAARLCVVRDQDVTKAEQQIVSAGGCRSNDLHVVALARAAACQLIFTSDKLLHSDLKNRILMPQRVSIYQRAIPSHKSLLTACTCK